MKGSFESGNNDELQEWSSFIQREREMEPCSSSELASRVKSVCEMVCELEDAHACGLLEKAINRVGMTSLLGAHLFGKYQRLSLRASPVALEFRSYWVKFALEAFSASLRPPNRIYMTVTGNTVLSGPINLEVAHDGLKLNIGQCQIISCRSWGIWFDFKNPELDTRLTSFLLSKTLERLASDLSCIDQMERALLKGGTKLDEARMNACGVGVDFARIIYDVLNEDAHVANFAKLIEDVMERTDLRLHYPGLVRKRGARVQISYADRKEHHISKQSKMHLGPEYVFISPYGLAESILYESSLPFLYGVDWHAFWSHFGNHTDDPEELAWTLKQSFNYARIQATDHPMGPLGLLRPELKQIIRAIAEHAAFSATNRLRWMERKRGAFLPSSRRQGR